MKRFMLLYYSGHSVRLPDRYIFLESDSQRYTGRMIDTAP